MESDLGRQRRRTHCVTQLLDHLETLKFIGVPAKTAAPEVRRALEEAWFEGVPLKIRYAGARETTTRRVRLESVVMERSETLVNALDLDKGEPRQFRLDRIEHAEVEHADPRHARDHAR